MVFLQKGVENADANKIISKFETDYNVPEGDKISFRKLCRAIYKPVDFRMNTHYQGNSNSIQRILDRTMNSSRGLVILVKNSLIDRDSSLVYRLDSPMIDYVGRLDMTYACFPYLERDQAFDNTIPSFILGFYWYYDSEELKKNFSLSDLEFMKSDYEERWIGHECRIPRTLDIFDWDYVLSEIPGADDYADELFYPRDFEFQDFLYRKRGMNLHNFRDRG